MSLSIQTWPFKQSPKTSHLSSLSSNSQKAFQLSSLSSVGAIHLTSPSTSSYHADLLLRKNHHHEGLHHPSHSHSNHRCPVPKDWWAWRQRTSQWWARNHASHRTGYRQQIVRTRLLVRSALRLLPGEETMLENLRLGRWMVLASGRRRVRTMVIVHQWFAMLVPGYPGHRLWQGWLWRVRLQLLNGGTWRGTLTDSGWAEMCHEMAVVMKGFHWYNMDDKDPPNSFIYIRWKHRQSGKTLNFDEKTHMARLTVLHTICKTFTRRHQSSTVINSIKTWSVANHRTKLHALASRPRFLGHSQTLVPRCQIK